MGKAVPFLRDRFTWLAYLMAAYFSYLQAALGPLMPFLRAELGLSYTIAGLHFSAFAFGMIMAGLIGERIIQYWGRRFVFWTSGAGMAVGTLLLTLSSQAFMSITSVLVMGSLGSLLQITIQAVLSELHGEQRIIALTEVNIAASISASLVPLSIGATQSAGFGWHAALLLAVIIFVLLAAGFRRVPIPEFQQPVISEPLRARRKLPIAFWGYWAVILLGVSIEYCMFFWGAEFLETVVGLNKSNASSIMSLFLLPGLLGRIAVSRLTHTVNGAALLLSAMGVICVGFPLFWLAPAAPLNIFGLLLAGLGAANLYPLTLSLAVSTAPEQSNAATARISLGAGIAILVSPFVLGWIADRVGIKSAYSIVALLLLMAVVVTFYTSRLETSKRIRASR